MSRSRRRRGKITSRHVDSIKEKLTLEELKNWRPTKEMWATGHFHQITGFWHDEHSDFQKSSNAENVRL